jgi:hypothetical protein
LAPEPGRGLCYKTSLKTGLFLLAQAGWPGFLAQILYNCYNLGVINLTNKYMSPNMSPTPMSKPAPVVKPAIKKPTKKPNIWLITTVILAIALIAVLAFTLPKTGADRGMTVVSAEEAGNTLVDFVNKIYGAQIGVATLKEVNELNGLYAAEVEVIQDGQAVDQTIYITRDAKVFIPQALEMSSMLEQFEAFQQQQQQLLPQ